MDVEEKGKSVKPPLRKIVAQRNHDSARVPELLEEYADKPLYLLIALWCLHQNGWSDRQQISDAFAITERRATFQMFYILRHKTRIDCLSRKVRSGGTGRLRLQIKVQQVDLTVASRRTSAKMRGERKKASRVEKKAGWRWVLMRQPPDCK
ncbi:CaiF/GrlA family transcriptional regulator [Erwinia sp.]|uniref:CaiF/GrlA family transcriptional regulator n=1 Tax=Erwinia citreus TaxID=558 RepID=UPI003C72F340